MSQGFVNNSGIALPVAVANGGTGATTAATARSNLSAAVTGANGDITSLTNSTGVPVHGTNTNDNASAGYVGELVSSVIASGSAVSLSSNVDKDLTSISLTAGDWDVYGNVSIIFVGSVGTFGGCWISTTSATFPDASLRNGVSEPGGTYALIGVNAPYKRISISGTTTVYISARCTFPSSTASMSGGIYARRVR